MPFPSIFDDHVVKSLESRIDRLTPTTTPKWGKMNVSQMLAHLCVAYDMAFTDKYPQPNVIIRTMLKWFVKDGVCGDKPYPHNSRTAPAFLITGERDFETEKSNLIAYIDKCRTLGASHFEGKQSLSFGPLTAQEWNTLFYKHLDHHLTQFGV